jgi:propanediol utilization protein
MNIQLDKIVDIVYEQIFNQFKGNGYIEIEASGRHAHLSREAVVALFGEKHTLTKSKDLSQPGQYSCDERVSLVGPKGAIHNVVVLGPERESTQIEVSMTDAKILGLSIPVRESGNVKGSPGLAVVSKDKSIALKEGVIIADRHIHMTPEDAEKLALADGDRVDVEVCTDRPVRFKNVKTRVSEHAATYMHIDYDEANACGMSGKTFGRIIKEQD